MNGIRAFLLNRHTELPRTSPPTRYRSADWYRAVGTTDHSRKKSVRGRLMINETDGARHGATESRAAQPMTHGRTASNARSRIVVYSALVLVLLFWASFVFASSSSAGGQQNRARRSPGAAVARRDNGEKGLQFRLSEGAEQPEHRSEAGSVQAAALSETEAQSLLQRLRPVKTDPTNEQEFAFRDRALPPPLTGATIKDGFPASLIGRSGPAEPPLSSLPEIRSGPLEVVRYAPEGDVPLAPHLTVTFSQPMVSLTSVEDAAARAVPVLLSPEPPGRWRWIGTKTLLFEPQHRFPMATRYSVEVPATAKSASGETLKSPKKWTFATPPPVVKTSYPNSGPQRRDQIMFVEFDQRIDPTSVLGNLRVRSGRGD